MAFLLPCTGYRPPSSESPEGVRGVERSIVEDLPLFFQALVRSRFFFNIIFYDILAQVVVDDVTAVLLPEIDRFRGPGRCLQSVALQPFYRLFPGDPAVKVAAGGLVFRITQIGEQFLDFGVFCGMARIQAGQWVQVRPFQISAFLQRKRSVRPRSWPCPRR